MSSIEKLLKLDKDLFLFLNNLGNESWDYFWNYITIDDNWWPVFVFIIFLLIKFYGIRRLPFFIIAIALLITFSDQFANLVKNTVARERPFNDDEIGHLVRLVYAKTNSKSFFSAHASTSMAVTLYIYLSLRKYTKYIVLLFIWPMVFAYSRIYLGIHFPSDIIVGYIVGVIIGFGFYKLSVLILNKISKKTY